MRTWFLGCTALLALSACSKAPEEKAATLMDDVSALIEANLSSCDGLRDKLLPWVQANGPELKKNMGEAQAKYKSLTKEDGRAMREKYRERAMRSRKTMREAREKCGSDPQVMQALRSLR